MMNWFAHPEALWLLLALLPGLAVVGAWAAWRRRRALGSVGRLVPRMLARRRRRARLATGACLGLSVGLLVMAVAGPQWGQEPTEGATGRDLVVVLDLSRSMLAELPSRQQRAARALRDLCDAVEKTGGHRLALVVFAAHARVACPLTHDYDHFRYVLSRQDAANPLPALRPQPGDATSGTRIGSALRAALTAVDPSFPAGTDLLVLSDGDDPAEDGEWLQGAAEARRQQLPVHVVAVGDPEHSYPIPDAGGWLRYGGQEVKTRLQERPLQEIARATGGVFIAARTEVLPLGRWLREVIEPHKAGRQEDDLLPTFRQHPEWFFAAALAFLTAPLVVGALRRRSPRRSPPALPPVPTRNGPLPSALPTTPPPALPLAAVLLLLLLVAAGPPARDALRRGNDAFLAEQFEEALQDYGQAARHTVDPGFVAFNTAATLYRLGRFREAELYYRRCLEDAAGARRARALFDLGNCLLRQAGDRDGRLLAKATESYRLCAREPGADPSLRDKAAYNRELARLLLLKARTAPNDASSEDGRGDDASKDDKRRARADEQRAGSEGHAPEDGPNEPDTKGEPGKRTAPAAGQGDLPALPDSDTLAALSPEDAVAYLDRVARRIRRERLEHRRTAARVVPNVKDW